MRVTHSGWYFRVILGWGLVVALHAVRVLLPSEVDRNLAAREAVKKQVTVNDGKLELGPKPPGGGDSGTSRIGTDPPRPTASP